MCHIAHTCTLIDESKVRAGIFKSYQEEETGKRTRNVEFLNRYLMFENEGRKLSVLEPIFIGTARGSIRPRCNCQKE